MGSICYQPWRWKNLFWQYAYGLEWKLDTLRKTYGCKDIQAIVDNERCLKVYRSYTRSLLWDWAHHITGRSFLESRCNYSNHFCAQSRRRFIFPDHKICWATGVNIDLYKFRSRAGQTCSKAYTRRIERRKLGTATKLPPLQELDAKSRRYLWTNGWKPRIDWSQFQTDFDFSPCWLLSFFSSIIRT
jgi:hypothetical protein